MFFPFLEIKEFPFEIVSGVVAGLICKAYFANRLKSKLMESENQTLKNQERIRELEELNDKLEKRLKDMETLFSKDSISLN